MKAKTISCHYDSVFSLAHNNRVFIPQNVDPTRTPYNYNCIVSGENAYLDFADPRLMQEFWARYKELDKLYWSNRSLANAKEYEHYRETMRYLCRCHQMMNYDPDNIVGLFFSLLMLPLTIWGHAVLYAQESQVKKEHIDYLKEKRKNRPAVGI